MSINFLKHPTLLQLYLFSGLWLIGNVLTLLAASDLFEQMLCKKEGYIFITSLVTSSVVLVVMWSNYFRNKRT